MIRIIVNKSDDGDIAHLEVDSRVFEECNTDQIVNKESYRLSLSDPRLASVIECVRCFGYPE